MGGPIDNKRQELIWSDRYGKFEGYRDFVRDGCCGQCRTDLTSRAKERGHGTPCPYGKEGTMGGSDRATQEGARHEGATHARGTARRARTMA
jgi:hypothetical protein